MLENCFDFHQIMKINNTTYHTILGVKKQLMEIKLLYLSLSGHAMIWK